MALFLGCAFILTGLGMVIINDDREGDILREEYRVYRKQMNVPIVHSMSYRPIHDELKTRFDTVVNQKKEDYVLV